MATGVNNEHLIYLVEGNIHCLEYFSSASCFELINRTSLYSTNQAYLHYKKHIYFEVSISLISNSIFAIKF